jgi:hypothetical protein
MNLNPQFLERMCDVFGDKIELASKVVEIISGWPTGSMQRIENSEIEKRDLPAAKEIVDTLTANGLLLGSSTSWERNSSACTPALAAALQGAAIARRVTQEKERPVIAATMPLGIGALGTILPSLGLQHAIVETTDAVFSEIARSAHRDFTIFAPFLNDEGALWIRDLLKVSPAIDRCLILRDWSRVKGHLASVMEDLSACNVSIFEYFLHHEDAYETFHAKILVGDDSRAYVGSANFLRYQKNSMELGVMVKGHAARTIRFISDAIRQVSRPVYGEKTLPRPA